MFKRHIHILIHIPGENVVRPLDLSRTIVCSNRNTSTHPSASKPSAPLRSASNAWNSLPQSSLQSSDFPDMPSTRAPKNAQLFKRMQNTTMKCQNTPGRCRRKSSLASRRKGKYYRDGSPRTAPSLCNAEKNLNRTCSVKETPHPEVRNSVESDEWDLQTPREMGKKLSCPNHDFLLTSSSPNLKFLGPSRCGTKTESLSAVDSAAVRLAIVTRGKPVAKDLDASMGPPPSCFRSMVCL